MNCIMVRLDGNSFIDVSNDWFHLVTSVYSRTNIVDIIGKMLCTNLVADEIPELVFREFLLSQIGYVVDQRNAGKDDFDREPGYTDQEQECILTYFIDCYKLNRPYMPREGLLKFMACVWHEEVKPFNYSACLIAEHFKDDRSISEAEPGSDLREPSPGNPDDRRYLSAVFK